MLLNFFKSFISLNKKQSPKDQPRIETTEGGMIFFLKQEQPKNAEISIPSNVTVINDDTLIGCTSLRLVKTEYFNCIFYFNTQTVESSQFWHIDDYYKQLFNDKFIQDKYCSYFNNFPNRWNSNYFNKFIIFFIIIHILFFCD